MIKKENRNLLIWFVVGMTFLVFLFWGTAHSQVRTNDKIVKDTLDLLDIRTAVANLDFTLPCWSVKHDTLSVKHDTLTEYVKEIKTKCDTTWGINWKPFYLDGEKYYRSLRTLKEINCHPDTVWAAKVAVFLTPDEYVKLREVLDADLVELTEPQYERLMDLLGADKK